MENFVGKKLDGRYEIQELIGIGGMAVVYRAYDRIDDRIVSIKILKDEFLGNREFTHRFRNESRAIAMLSHPNIVKVYDVCFGDRLQYIVMEYIDGITLKEYIEQQKVLSWKETVHFTLQVLQALSHAHSKGIIHRDIKPQNIMLLSNGTIKVTDFGIAHFANGETRTMTDKVIGSVHYIAPEQAKGSTVDEKADIYSIGVMMYEMLTGKLPFEAENAVSVAIMQLQSEAKNPRAINASIPEGLEEITMKAMKKEPGQRFAETEEMIDAINQFKENPAIRFQYKYFSEATSTKNFLPQNNSNRIPVVEEEEPEIPEKDPNEHDRAYAVPIITGVGVAFALFAVVFTVILFVRGILTSNQTEDVWLPSFVGENHEEIVEKYDGIFEFEISYAENGEVEQGDIISQEPKGDIKNVKKGSLVKITVSAGETIVIMDNVVNKEQSEAIRILTGKNLRYQVVEVYHETVAKGYVVSTTPAAGDQVASDQEVILYVSQGAEERGSVVGKYVGQAYSQAIDQILRDGFKVANPVYQDSDKPKDTVLEQSPAEGSSLEIGSAITLVLSNGKNFKEDKTVTLDVVLPSGSPSDLNVVMNVYDESNVRIASEPKVVLSGTEKVTYSITGTGTRTAIITVNGKTYQKWSVNLNDATAKVTETTPITFQTESSEPASSVASSEEASSTNE